MIKLGKHYKGSIKFNLRDIDSEKRKLMDELFLSHFGEKPKFGDGDGYSIDGENFYTIEITFDSFTKIGRLSDEKEKNVTLAIDPKGKPCLINHTYLYWSYPSVGQRYEAQVGEDEYKLYEACENEWYEVDHLEYQQEKQLLDRILMDKLKGEVIGGADREKTLIFYGTHELPDGVQVCGHRFVVRAEDGCIYRYKRHYEDSREWEIIRYSKDIYEQGFQR